MCHNVTINCLAPTQLPLLSLFKSNNNNFKDESQWLSLLILTLGISVSGKTAIKSNLFAKCAK